MKQKYNQYKPTQADWLQQIPIGWEFAKIASIFTERKEAVSDKDFAPLSVTMQGILPQLETAAKTENGDNRKKVCVGDFVINSRSDRKGSGGVSKLEGSVSVISTVLKPSKNLDGGFINYVLTNYYFQEEFYKYGKGIVADLWSTKFSSMKTMYIPLPPSTEQTAIANYLDAQTEKINLFIAQKQKLIELLKERKQAVIDKAVTKGIDEKAELKNTGLDWFGEIPEHWTLRRLGSIGRFYKGGNISRSELVETETDFPAILYGDIYTKYGIEAVNIVNRISEETANNSVELVKGDLLFTGSGEAKEDIGKCVVYNSDGKCFAGGDVIIFKQKPFDNTFIGYSQNSSVAKFQKAVSSKGEIIVHTYVSKLKEVLMPFPPAIEEQKEIVQHIKAETATIDKAIDKTEREIELIKEYKEAMIAEAVMGKIEISKSAPVIKPKAKVEPSWEFKEAVLISVLTDKFGSTEFPLGRMRYTKFSYLFHRHTDNKTEGYLKKAAGPYNPKTKYGGPEKIALQNKYITKIQSGKLSGFVASEKIQEAKNYFGYYWNADSLNWLEQLRYKKNDELELYATVDKVMVELAGINKSIDLLSVKQLIEENPEWKPKLEREIFNDENVTKAIKFLQQLFV